MATRTRSSNNLSSREENALRLTLNRLLTEAHPDMSEEGRQTLLSDNFPLAASRHQAYEAASSDCEVAFCD
ncbi:Hypothetical protein FKW44_018653 [Caligus rogercresseyi]|uniref:Uncharacterized protein n=1 Tax=Caligus rogercresseyi TaxID=217165 RepID=A0A7T8JXL0_CALRO|nr:Hypothetical protein FKW44_018653 [Caligus rogercresseyi]